MFETQSRVGSKISVVIIREVVFCERRCGLCLVSAACGLFALRNVVFEQRIIENALLFSMNHLHVIRVESIHVISLECDVFPV